MLLTHNSRIKDSRSWLQRIYCRIYTKLHYRTRQYCRGIQMGKRSCRSWVSQVVCWHINRLNRRDGTILGGGDALLQSSHLCLQCRLIPYCGRHTSKQSRNLWSCLCKTENIIYKQKNIFSALITEILCHGKTSQSHSHSSSRRLIHLTKYHGSLADNARFLHLII